MEKLYTQEQYYEAVLQANKQGKKVSKIQEQVEYPIEVLEWEKKTIYVPVIDPETGEPTGEEQSIEVDDYTKPIMIDEVDPETGETHKVQKHHTEYRTKWVERIEIVDNPENFDRCFFETSLGYVRRKVHMLTGERKDFLGDMVAGLKSGMKVITYDRELNGTEVTITKEFLTECITQYQKDFKVEE